MLRKQECYSCFRSIRLWVFCKSVKYMFWKHLQNSQENNWVIKMLYAVSIRDYDSFPCNLIPKRIPHGCLTVNFDKFPKTTFSRNTSGRRMLLLLFMLRTLLWSDIKLWLLLFPFLTRNLNDRLDKFTWLL